MPRSLAWAQKLNLCTSSDTRNRGAEEVSLGLVPNAQESVMGPKVESLYKQRY